MLGSKPIEMGRPKKQTVVLLVAAFVVGTAIAYPMLRLLETNPSNIFGWLILPALPVFIPVYILGGGVHGASMEIYLWSTVVGNGIGYALLVGLGLWIKRRFSGQRKQAGIGSNAAKRQRRTHQ